jgi:hypothetical protein
MPSAPSTRRLGSKRRLGWARLREDAEDLAFFDELGEERPEHGCQAVGCTRGSIELSVLCRRHHFEMVKRKPCPVAGD